MIRHHQFKSDNDPLIMEPYIPKIRENYPHSRSHFALIMASGKILDFHVKGMKMMKLNWTMKVPDSAEYFAFSANRKIHIIYGHDRPITYLKSNTFHRTIQRSNPSIFDELSSEGIEDWSKKEWYHDSHVI